MNEKEIKQQVNKPAEVIEDLTLNETEMENVKGGPTDYLLELDGIKGESRAARKAGYDISANKKI